MNQLQVFKNELFEVGAILENGEVLFDVELVAKCLGFTEVKSEKIYIRWRTVNGHLSKYISQDVAKGDLIPEPLVYKLAFKASNDVAEKFQDWLAIEVIPAIRKYGAYLTPNVLEQAIANPDFTIGLLTQLKAEQEEKSKLKSANLALEQQVSELKPKATYCDLILQNKSLLSTTAIAKDYGMGAPSFNKKLHELGVQYKQSGTWFLYAKYQDKGYTQTSTFPIDEERSSVSTKWTQKGRSFLYNLLKQNGILPVIEREVA